MSLKNLLTEIQTGIWLIETNSPEHYSEIVKQIKLGAFVNEKQEKFYSVIGKEATNRQTGQSEMKDQVAVISMIGEMLYADGIDAVVEVGLIIDQEATFDEQGNMLTEPTYREGYHFDIMSEKEINFGENEIFPNNPKHTFAGFNE